MRQPIKIGANRQRRKDIASTMAAGGINRRELSQLLGVGVSQKMNNWLIDAQGQLFRSGQMSSVFNYSNWKEITLFKHWLDNLYIVSYTEVSTGDYKTQILDLDTDTLNESYLAYGAPAGAAYSPLGGTSISGQKYGNYFIVGSPVGYGDKLYIFNRYLFNTVTTPFVAGELVTGVTSGATALVLEVNNLNKHLSIGNLSGTFIDGEQITGSASGDGILDYAMGYMANAVANIYALYVYSFVAPAGSSAGARLYAVNHRDDRTLTQFSDVDDGSNPPFKTWQTGAAVDQGGYIYNKNAEEANAVTSAGATVIVGYDVNNIGFTIEAIDVGGTQTKITPIIFNDTDKGMAPGAISTSKGVFYGVDKVGFYQLLDGGQTNAPFSRNELKISLNLENGYFDDVNMDSLKIAHVPEKNIVIFSYFKSSYSPNANVGNNVQFIYNTETKAISEMDLPLDIIIEKNNVVYATGTYTEDAAPIYLPAEIDSLEHDIAQGQDNSLVMIDATHFILAYRGANDYGFIKTFSIDVAYGTITEIDSLQHDTALIEYNSLVMIDATHFALAYKGADNDGFIKTFSIDGSYDNITEIDSLEHDLINGTYNSLVLLDSTNLLLAYAGDAGDGYIKTFSIDGSYDNITEIDSLEHDTDNGTYNSLVLEDSTHAVLAYRGLDGDGYIKTFSIDGGYAITEIDVLEHDFVTNSENSLAKLSDGYYVLAYTGDGDDGYVKTFSLDSSYLITEVDSLEHNTTQATGNSVTIIDSTHFAVAYKDGGDDGIIKTFAVGTIIEELNELEHDTLLTGFGPYNSLVLIDATHLALAYAGENDDGFIKTFSIDNTTGLNVKPFVGNIFQVFSGKTNGDALSQTTATFEQEFRPTGITGLFDVNKIIIQADTDENSKLDVVFTGIDEDRVETEYTRTIDTSNSEVPFGKDALYEFEIEIPQIWRLKVKLEDNDSSPGTAVNAINYVKIDFVDRGEEIIENTITS